MHDQDELLIRLDRPGDFGAVRHIHRSAFSGDEARLVETLRQNGKAVASLVAEFNGQTVGHVLFSPVTLDGVDHCGVGLAPLAVLPEFRGRGIASQLVREGLEACMHAGYEWVVTLGEPAFYSRFGFRPAAAFGLACDYPGAGDAFQARELIEEGLDGLGGTVLYADEFRMLEPQPPAGLERGNLLAGIPAALPEELIETLAMGNNCRVERIVSRGHTTPEGEWYDQDEHEWVVLIRGAARVALEREEGEELVELRPGDWLDIPARVRHRVTWTDPQQESVWLAVLRN